jgi:predicted transcriptional regulator
LIGWFLLQNAQQSAQFARVQSQLVGLVAADAVTANSPIVSAKSSLRAFVDFRTLEHSNWQRFLVTDQDGQLLGSIDVDDLKKVASELWPTTLVTKLMKPIEATTMIEFNQPLMKAIEQLEKYHLPALNVVGENGSLVGLLEKTAIVHLVQQRSSTVSV